MLLFPSPVPTPVQKTPLSGGIRHFQIRIRQHNGKFLLLPMDQTNS